MTTPAAPDRDLIELPVVVFDDTRGQVESILEREIKWCRPVRYVDRVQAVARAVRELPPGSTLLLDQHVPGVENLGEAGPEFEGLRTERGTSVGLTMAMSMIPILRPDGDLRVYVMSLRPLDDDAERTLKRGMARKDVQGFIRKNDLAAMDDLMVTEDDNVPTRIDVRQYIGFDPNVDAGEKSSTNEGSIEPMAFDMIDYAKRLAAAEKMLTQWSRGDLMAVAHAFGFPASDAGDWTRLREHAHSTYSADLSLRADAVIDIKKALVMVYRSSNEIEKEIAYLRDPDEFLDGRTPWEMITSSDMAGLVRTATMFAQLF